MIRHHTGSYQDIASKLKPGVEFGTFAIPAGPANRVALVLLGPSWCGKSTLLSIIAGLEPSSGGDISSANATSPYQRHVWIGGALNGGGSQNPEAGLRLRPTLRKSAFSAN